MRLLIFIWLFTLQACQEQGDNHIFSAVSGRTDVEICLKDYGLDTIPAAIGRLKSAKRITVFPDTVTGFTLYPPLSALGQQTLTRPLRHLPGEITELTQLESLTLVGLDLVTLPDGFGRLKNLDTLILYMNQLTISNELGKLKELKKLKYLGLLGNKITASDLEELEKAIPGIVTNPGLR